MERMCKFRMEDLVKLLASRDITRHPMVHPSLRGCRREYRLPALPARCTRKALAIHSSPRRDSSPSLFSIPSSCALHPYIYQIHVAYSCLPSYAPPFAKLHDGGRQGEQEKAVSLCIFPTLFDYFDIIPFFIKSFTVMSHFSPLSPLSAVLCLASPRTDRVWALSFNRLAGQQNAFDIMQRTIIDSDDGTH